MKQLLLTTVDNPYHPVDEMEKWLDFDHTQGYFTDQRLAKVCPTSINLTDAENQRVINGAILDFLRLDETGLYKAIVED